MHCSVERKLGKGYQKTLALGNEPPAPKSEIDSRDHTSDGRRIAGSPVVASWGTAKGLTAKDGTSDRVDREDIASHLFDPFAWSGSVVTRPLQDGVQGDTVFVETRSSRSLIRSASTG